MIGRSLQFFWLFEYQYSSFLEQVRFETLQVLMFYREVFEEQMLWSRQIELVRRREELRQLFFREVVNEVGQLFSWGLVFRFRIFVCFQLYCFRINSFFRGRVFRQVFFSFVRKQWDVVFVVYFEYNFYFFRINIFEQKEVVVRLMFRQRVLIVEFLLGV